MDNKNKAKASQQPPKQKQTIIFKNPPRIIGNFSIVGKSEGNGAFGEYFQCVADNDTFGEKTYEKSERIMLEKAIFGAIKSAQMEPAEIDVLLSGDLLNQIISSSFAARKFGTTFIGLYGACSTMAESIALGSCLIDAKYFNYISCATASHFSSAERQYRFPLELGNQRPPYSQWTVTGAGSCVLSSKGKGPKVTSVTFGKVVDFGIKDVNNMGAAMAPAAMNTIVAHLQGTQTSVSDYDLIVTGDLGRLGSEILIDLLEKNDVFLDKRYMDCGCAMYTKKHKVFMGGSGAGCSASVLNAYILEKIKQGVYKKVLFVATGALLSTTSSQQGDSIPCIAHAVVIEGE
ncbi:MAG: stage V sporulation protein AD [Clostridia bacterium]|nr:stage V sporulation protein AD [Clostridia bacterium]